MDPPVPVLCCMVPPVPALCCLAVGLPAPRGWLHPCTSPPLAAGQHQRRHQSQLRPPHPVAAIGPGWGAPGWTPGVGGGRGFFAPLPALPLAPLTQPASNEAACSLQVADTGGQVVSQGMA